MAMEKLVKKHEAERQSSLQELRALKSKMTEREQKISRDYQNKFDQLRGDIDKMNSKFQV